MAKTSVNKSPQNLWQYIDWLYNSNRLTAEEHLHLKKFALKLEAETGELAMMDNQGC